MAIREPDTSPQPGGSRVRALAQRFETGADPSESNNEKTSVSSSNKMLLVVELRKTTASSNQPARTPLVRSRNSHRRRPQSSSEPSISKSRSTGVMRKSESAHPTICSLDVPGPKPRRCGKPPPPVKPEGLSQRVKALNPNLGPIIVSEPTTQPSTRGSAAEHERTEETVPDKPTNVPSISRTPSNRTTRPRLAPPPPPPKKPTSSPTPPEKPPREQIRVSVVQEQPCTDIYQQLPSPEETFNPPAPSTSCDEGLRPSVPTIPLPQPPDSPEDDNGEYECYERIDFCYESQPSSGRTETDRSPGRDRLSETFSQAPSSPGGTSRHSFPSPGMNTLPRFTGGGGSQSSTLGRKKTSPRYPSSMDFEKFLRIKSNLQQNISKKMDQLRQKVGDKRISAVFTSDATKESEYDKRCDELATDASPKSTDEDIYVYGDEWSSDDDDGLYARALEP